jgi:hypothetical protein
MAASFFTSLYPSIASWFTPTYLFCFLNLTIATIFIVSNFKSHNQTHQFDQNQYTQFTEFNSSQLGRAPSLLERVKSIDFSIYKYDITDPVQLERRPSLLERVKSFSVYKHEQTQPDPDYHEVQNLEPTRVVRYPSFLQRVVSFSRNEVQDEQTQRDPNYHELQNAEPTRIVQYPSFLQRVVSFSRNEEEKPEPDSEPVKLVRYPSLLQRVNSIKAALYKSEQPDPVSDPRETGNHVARSKSEKAPEKSKAKKMKKWASVKNVGPSEESDDDVDRRRPKTTRERKKVETASFGDEEVDAKADDFINRFKQQLKLQRLDSLIRYREQNRGGGGSH